MSIDFKTNQGSTTSFISPETIQLLLSKNNDSPASLLDSVSENQKKLLEVSKNSKPVQDAYSNTLTSTGTADKVESFTNYGFTNDTLNWWLWLALYNDSWVFRKVIDKPSQDVVRTGITLNLDNKKKQDVYDILTKLQSQLIEINQWGALFGGSVGVMMFDTISDDDYSKPLNIKKLKNAKNIKIYVTDRWYGVSITNQDTVSSMNSIDFGKPKQYAITFANGKTLQVHHDYILRYEHRTAPKLVKNGQLQGWGYAEGCHVINELSRDDKLKSAITSLINKALIEVIKMSGMRGVFMGADSDNEQQLRKRLEMVNWARNFNSLTFLDKDDEYQEHSFSGLSGLSDLLETNMWLVAAAVDMPGILFGELKGGLSQETEALERYDEVIQNKCDTYYRPVLEKLLHVIYKMLEIKEPVSFTFNSLQAKKHDKEKMEGLKEFVDLLSQMLGDGAITTSQYAKALLNYSKNGIIDFDISDEDIEKLKDKTEEEMESIDLDEDLKKEKETKTKDSKPFLKFLKKG